MEPSITDKQIVSIEKVPTKNIRCGQILCFESGGKFIIHRVMGRYGPDGKAYFLTKADVYPFADSVVSEKQVVGVIECGSSIELPCYQPAIAESIYKGRIVLVPVNLGYSTLRQLVELSEVFCTELRFVSTRTNIEDKLPEASLTFRDLDQALKGVFPLLISSHGTSDEKDLREILRGVNHKLGILVTGRKNERWVMDYCARKIIVGIRLTPKLGCPLQIVPLLSYLLGFVAGVQFRKS
jgi:hypothetical protein